MRRPMKTLRIYKGHALTPEQVNFLAKFSAWATKTLGITLDFNILLSAKGQVAGITTGGYNPYTNEIVARIEGRAPVDCARTIAHELVHLNQRQDGRVVAGVPVQDIGGEIEDEANAKAGSMLKQYALKYGRDFYEW